MQHKNGEDTWQLTVTSNGQIIKIRNELSILLRRAEFSASDQTLLITTVSELGRSLLTFTSHFELNVVPINSGKHKGVTFAFLSDNPNILLFGKNGLLDNSESDLSINRLKSIFNKVTQNNSSKNSQYSLSITKWIDY